jgi:YggT family protein
MIIKIVELLFQVYMVMLFIRILVSWVPEFQTHKAILFVAYYTDPYLNFFRKYIPPLGMIDFSPIVAFLSLGVIEQVVKYFIQLIVR